MSTQVQFRRGTAAQHESFIGALGELTVDITNNTLRVHDGVTPGGHPVADMDGLQQLISGLQQEVDDLEQELTTHKAEDVQDGVHGFEVESGVWTPTLYGSSGSGEFQYNIRHGRYVRQDKLVYFSSYIGINENPNLSGQVRVGGLPYNKINADPPAIVGTVGQIRGIKFPSTHPYLSALVRGGNYIDFMFSGDAGQTNLILQGTDITAIPDFRLMVSGVYEIA